jgi:hypothetical protein
MKGLNVFSNDEEKLVIPTSKVLEHEGMPFAKAISSMIGCALPEAVSSPDLRDGLGGLSFNTRESAGDEERKLRE